ncbi:3-oxo-tetronate kinase [Glycomyces tenuis]|uniref:3-oxo-tetronate kinase n=1 Tax=Glycomyces tenuis TaxID=58116 RepID=UPI00041B291D|nr:3-oxo-tetronate kinase [Glycomyces tenuis]
MIGTIADDMTGGTDAAVAFHRQGLRTGVYFDTPPPGGVDAALDAAVIALKTRTIPAADAVAQSLAAAERLREAGASRLYFKYCSTFDSTAEGNIGPVFDALAAFTGTDAVVTTPSSPEHGRTAYQGHLFVHDRPLAESPMRDHPLTPMRDSSLVRLMDAQTAAGAAAVLPHRIVRDGAEALAARIAEARTGHRYLFPDAITDDDLLVIARAIADEPLSGGGAGLAGALARIVAERGGPRTAAPERPPGGTAVVLAGSCSRRTLEQVDLMRRAGRPAHRLDAAATPDPHALAEHALAWYDALDPGRAPLIYSSLPPAELAAVQRALGTERSAEILEAATARIARGLRRRGVTRFVCAGGETSGAIVAALAVGGGVIGAEAARGVPWIRTGQGLDLLLKSGNFGEPDLLLTASAAEERP